MLRTGSGSPASKPPCFNPHPPRRADATVEQNGDGDLEILFQSSSAPEGGCYEVGSNA